MITVTRTFFPPLKEYNAQLERIWNNKWLTNRGELVRELELKLKNYLEVPNVLAMANGTLPIQLALNAYGNHGEIITTPFSYVATTSTIIWENCIPIFVDIHPEYLTIDETKIEQVITDRTTAILVTHVYGNPCDVESIESIANKYNLKVIYDAAHCFGVNYKKKSIFNYGDISVCSFHATKLFHTGEGGALFCNSDQIYHEMDYRHRFGHNGPLNYHGVGLNAKMSELQAAMGLTVLPYMDEIIQVRKEICSWYDNFLDFKFIYRLKIRPNTEWNYSYYPIIFNSEYQLLQTVKLLNQNAIYPRRYFYPSLSKLPYVDNANDVKISEDIANRVLCLPLYNGLEMKDVQRISTLILDSFQKER